MGVPVNQIICGFTGKACVLEGFDFIGIEKSKEFVAIAKQRIMEAKKGKK